MRYAFALLATAALAMPALAQKPPSAEQVLARFLSVTGGAAAYAKVKTQVTTGTLLMPAQNIQGSFTLTFQAPDKMRLAASVPGIGEIGQGYDGKTAWARDPFSGVRTMSGEELEQIRLELTLSNDPGSWKKVFKKVELLPAAKVEGKKAWRVRLTPKKGPAQTLFFDVASGLLVRRDSIVATPQGRIPTETYLSDYRTVEGVKMPFKTRVVSGMGEQQMLLTGVKNNGPVDPKVFARPASEPAKKTKM